MNKKRHRNDDACCHRPARAARNRRPLSLRLFLLAGAALTPVYLLPPQQAAQAAIAGSDQGWNIVPAGPASAAGSGGGLGASASADSIAMAGGGDCGRLTGSTQTANSGLFDAASIWGSGDANRTNGLYGFGAETAARSSDDGSNKGGGQANGYTQNNPAGAAYGNIVASANTVAQTQAWGSSANAIGCDSQANGFGAQAMGWGAWANGAGSVAFGINSRATGQGTLAFGIGATATGEDSIAQGSLSTASNKGAIAFGALTAASGANATAIGAGDTLAGTGAQATGDNSVALGYKTQAAAANATAIGAGDASNSGAAATAASATALGYKAAASVADGVALGSQSVAATAAGAAGYDAVTGAPSGKTGSAWVSTLGAASVGDAASGKTRQLTGLAAGSQDTDAVNLAQLKGLADVAVLYDSAAKDTVTLGGASGTKITRLAAGALSAASADAVNGSQLFATNNNVSANATAINTVAANTGSYLGGGADVARGIAPGYTVQGSAANNVGDAFKFVDSNFNTVNSTIAANAGNIKTITSNLNNALLGPVQRPTASDDALVLTDMSGTAANPGHTQRLGNVASGTISSTSTDAVNGSQLQDVHNQINRHNQKIAAYFGGGAAYIDYDNWTAPSYALSSINTDGTTAGGSYNTVGSALNTLDSSLSNVNYRINSISKDINNGNLGPVRRTSGDNLALLAANGTADSPSNAQKLTNLAAGTLSGSSTDAVNGSQLFATNNNVTANTGNIANNKNTIIANAAAVTAAATNTSRYLGGGANVANNIAPGFTMQKGSYNNVSDTFKAVDNNFDTVHMNIAANTATITALSDSAVQYDNSATKGTVTLGGASGTKITRLAAGALSAASADAVNGSQLFATNNNVTANTGNIAANKTAIGTVAANSSAWFGGGADVAAGIAPSYTVQKGSYKTIGTAFAAVDSSFDAVNASLANIVNNINDNTTGPVQRIIGDNLALVGAGGTAAAPGNSQRLSNLAAGALSADSADAVNGSQLFATNNSVIQNAADIVMNKADIAANKTGIAANTATITALSDSAVQYDNSATKGTVTLGGASGTKITRLAAGALAADSADAVNGSQLFATNNSVIQNAADIMANTGNIAVNKTAIGTVAANSSAYFGGGADVAAGMAPTYTVQKGSYNSVGTAFAAVDSSFDAVNASLANIVNNINDNTTGPVQRTIGDNLVLVGAGGTAAAPGNSQRLSNLAAGILAIDSTDAVTGAQLYGVIDSMDSNNKTIASFLGGGASLASFGGLSAMAITPPTFPIRSYDDNGNATSKDYNSVGDALTALDDSLFGANSRLVKNTQDISTINNRLTDIGNGAAGPVQRSGGDNLVLVGAGGTAASPGSPQKLTNVAAGAIGSGSTDAVNGGQLNDTNKRIDGIDTRVGNLEGQIREIGSGGKNAVQYDTDSNGNKTNSVTLQGADASAPVALHNVADGKVEEDSKDAVNGGQLREEVDTSAAKTLKSANDYTDSRIGNITAGAVEEANQYTDMRFDRLNHRLDKVRKEARSAAAIGLAAASLRFDDTPGKLSIGFGGGYWKSEGAMAFGAGYTSDTGRFRSNVTGTMARGSLGVGGGLTIRLN